MNFRSLLMTLKTANPRLESEFKRVQFFLYFGSLSSG